MVQTRSIIYKRAYTELNEIIKELSKAEREKIPLELIKNIEANISEEYKWKYDNSKTLLEQKILLETKALLVEIYEKYLSEEDEKEFWKEYDKICLKNIEELKESAFKNNNIFKAKEENIIKHEIVERKKDTFLKKIFNKIRNIFKR